MHEAHTLKVESMDPPIIWCNKRIDIKFAWVIVSVLGVTSVSTCSSHKVCLSNCQHHNTWRLKHHRSWNTCIKNLSLTHFRTFPFVTTHSTTPQHKTQRFGHLLPISETFCVLLFCVVLCFVTKGKVLKYVRDKTYVKSLSKIHVIQLRLRR